MSAGGESTKVVVLALLANLGIAIAKLIGAMVSGSASMLAEAVHSLVDTANQVLLLIGGKKARKAPTDAHPLGYGREAFFWSFLVAILLFSMGGLFAIYEGVHKFSAPETRESVGSPFLALSILAISLVLEGLSFRACIREVRRQNRYGDLWTWFRRTTSSDLLVIFTEDAAAMIGLLIATTSLLVSWLTGDSAWDAVGSILVGLLLVLVAAFLAVEIKSLIIGEASSTDFRPFLESEVAHRFPEGRLLRLLALQIGPHEVLLSYKIDPGRTMDVPGLIIAINSLEKATRKAFPEVRWQFVEPDSHA